MSSTYRLASQQLTGLLAGFVEADILFATVSGAFTLKALDLEVVGAPSGGTVVAQVNTVTGGGGSALLQGTILDGTTSIAVAGSIPMNGVTSFYLRVVSESGGALSLSASVDLLTADGEDLTVFLTTLESVKGSLGVANSDNDATILQHIAGASRSMQDWMDRDIARIVITGEPHFPAGLGSGLVVDMQPILTIEAVRVNGSALDTAAYRSEGGGLVRRMSGNIPIEWGRSGAVEIDYTAGFRTVPPGLADACTSESVRRWRQSIAAGGHGPHVVGFAPDVGDSKTFEQEGFMPQTVTAMLPYRRRF